MSSGPDFSQQGRGRVARQPLLFAQMTSSFVLEESKNMERKRTTPSLDSHEEQFTSGGAEVLSIAQIQGLVRLLDRSDVSELEFKRASEGIHLVLRKVKATDGFVPMGEVVNTASANGVAPVHEDTASPDQYKVVAPLVGIFHPWLKPRGGTLTAVGDRVKAGQLVGTIESLNVFNEVETTVAGRVVEIHVQDGQPVEYGQVLVTIDCSEAEGA
jgi:acetyl-CoA carboxylase biotin carboxyl carrier protein